MHPEYDEEDDSNDIAVIELKTALKFSSSLGKIDLVEEGYVPQTGGKFFIFKKIIYTAQRIIFVFIFTFKDPVTVLG